MSQKNEDKYECPISAELIKDNKIKVEFNNSVPIYKNKINFIIGESGKGKSIWALSLSDLLDRKVWKDKNEKELQIDIKKLKKVKRLPIFFKNRKAIWMRYLQYNIKYGKFYIS